jgi:hypothetical protein
MPVVQKAGLAGHGEIDARTCDLRLSTGRKDEGLVRSVGHPRTWHHDELISELEVSGPLLRVLVQSCEFPHADDHVYRGESHLW